MPLSACPVLLPNQGRSESLKLCCTSAHISATLHLPCSSFLAQGSSTISLLPSPEILSRVNLLHFCIQPLMHFDTLYWSFENQNKIVCGMSRGAGEILHVSAACVKTERKG